MPLALRIPARINTLGNPGQEAALLDVWRKTASEAGLAAAAVHQVQIVHHGLEITGQ